MTTLFQIQKPEAIVVGQNVNYTVPAGRVAKVAVCLSCSASTRFSPGPTVSVSNPFAAGSNSNSISEVLTLRAGDVLSSSRVTGA